MKRISLIGLMVLAFGCQSELKGPFTVQKAMVLKDKSDKNHTLNPGTYTSKIASNSKKSRIEMTVTVANREAVASGPESKDLKFYFNVPAGKSIPSVSGDFDLTSAESGQPTDLMGHLDTVVANGPKIHTEESCQFQDRQWMCRWMGNPPRQVCRWEPIWRQGWRMIEYYDRTTTQTISGKFFDTTAHTLDALFSGQNVERERIYLYQGPCH